MKRVLCVSDDGVQLGKWRLRLGREGYVVVSALGVDEARSYARECRFDLVIMGLATPGQRTDDLARELHAMGTPVLAVLRNGEHLLGQPDDALQVEDGQNASFAEILFCAARSA
jgi:DNA-binding response OmpR family regulator